MRHLEIATKNKEHLHLEAVPEGFQFIEAIAKRYADTNDELKHFYLIGIDAAEKFRIETSEENYNSKVVWIVEQTIKLARKKNSRYH